MAAGLLNSSLGRFRLISFSEGLSFLILLGIAMPLKYIWKMPEYVRIVGMLHGILFISYIAFLVMASIECKWTLKTCMLLFISSIFPFGFLFAENMFLKKEANKNAA